jgi:hypothetical protein
MSLIIGLAIFGALFSIFLGLYAVRIHVFGGHEPYEGMRKPSWQFWVYQFWFNFVCSVLGWAVMIHYINRYQCERSKFEFTGADAVPVIVGLLGITGCLPRALWAFSELAGNLSKKITG